MKMLVVDDNEDTCAMLKLLLHASGFEVRTAGSVSEALKAFADEPFDVLLSDIGLPDGSGWDLLRALRQRASPPFAIAMSGFGMPLDLDSSAEVGFRVHLVKPIDWPDLKRVLDQASDEIASET